MKFSVSLRYVLRFVFEFDKIQMGDDVIVASFRFSAKIVYISNSIEPTNFTLGTNVQGYTVHLLIRVK